MKRRYSICFNPDVNNAVEVMEKLKSILNNRGVEFEVLDIDNLKSGFDFAFVIGGDGTILKAARFYSGFGTLIFGINLGRLGFLSQAGMDSLEPAVDDILNSRYKTEERIMLQAQGYNALNDFVVKGDTCARTSNFALEIDGKFVCEYLADGVIISTPTGSTAYSMAAGGPILTPEIDTVVITPICPHTFSARPIVVSANSQIAILPCGNNEYRVSADGQVAFSTSEKLVITKSQNRAKLALLNDNDFFMVLRNKLNWGYSPAKI